ncbi:MAG: hypothetical protein KFW07_01475 [Mycoplasmataceae bacterium]|nr:hypothetical protein [Mycoplasmataceae bacterium]
MEAISKIVETMYRENRPIFSKNANLVLRNFYSIPLEQEDLILHCLQQLISKGKNFIPTEEYTLEQFLFSNIKYIMYSYCRSYTNNGNKILNNYVDFDSVENFYSETYISTEISFNFLSKYHRDIIHDLYVEKMTSRQVALKNTTTSQNINREVKKIKEIIAKRNDNHIDLC